MAVSMLAEGNSIRSIERMADQTIARSKCGAAFLPPKSESAPDQSE